MRRRDREVTDTIRIDQWLQEAPVGRIGMIHQNLPYVVPVNFCKSGNAIYFHSAREGRKIEALKDNPQVFFEVDQMMELITGERGCDYSATFWSVMIEGTASFVDKEEEKKEALDRLLEKYSQEKKADWNYSSKLLTQTAIIKIAIQSLSAKAKES